MNTIQPTSQPASPSLTAKMLVSGFAPGWFAAVMGTGAFALATLRLSHELPDWSALSGLAWGLHGFNLLLFVLLLGPWLARWLLYRQAAMATFRHPVMAHFYPTFAIALLVIAGQLRAFGGHEALALPVWWFAAGLTWLFSFMVLFNVFRSEQVTLEHISPAIFIPPVGLVVIPIAGGPLLAQQPAAWQELALLVNYGSLGAGALMYLSLLALVIHRFFVVKPLPGMLVPTVWIHLGPLGAMAVSALNLAAAGPLPGFKEPLILLALLLWGFGVWWLVMVIALTWTAYRQQQLPFSLAWWAFTFPLGAFTLGSQRLADTLGLTIPMTVGAISWGLLAFLWTATLFRTLAGAASGALFKNG
ncbi:MAG: C4-dicarboxylate ABC transporter [Candidatus Competibacteraceae bacterium]|nr:C4-dicarboxylate ABC transporter [Candidatus Competibacteraceae bacterium]